MQHCKQHTCNKDQVCTHMYILYNPEPVLEVDGKSQESCRSDSSSLKLANVNKLNSRRTDSQAPVSVAIKLHTTIFGSVCSLSTDKAIKCCYETNLNMLCCNAAELLLCFRSYVTVIHLGHATWAPWVCFCG